jgi:hypothetical protein
MVQRGVGRVGKEKEHGDAARRTRTDPIRSTAAPF